MEKHAAVPEELIERSEEILGGTPGFRGTRVQGRYLLIGNTEAGRYLAVVLGPRGRGVYGLITARDADQAERRLYQRHRRR